jgi:hypothetical protein
MKFSLMDRSSFRLIIVEYEACFVFDWIVGPVEEIVDQISTWNWARTNIVKRYIFFLFSID